MKKTSFLLALLLFLPHFALAGSLSSHINAPENYTGEFATATGVSRFTIDAEVDIPQVEFGAIPIHEVALRSFTDDEIQEMVSAFGFENPSEVKKQEKEVFKPWNPIGFDYLLENKKMSFYASNGNNQASGRANHTSAEFMFKPGPDMANYYPIGGTLPIRSESLGNGMTLEEATKIASEAAAQIAPELSLSFTGEMMSEAYMTVEDTDLWNMSNDREMPPGAPLAYRFLFTRTIGGIPVTYTHATGSGEDSYNETYTDFYSYECLDIVVAGFGLAGARYVSPYEMKGIWQEDCGELLPFDQAMRTAETMLKLKYASKEISAMKQADYQINRITFGLARVMLPSEPDRCILIPVWDFFGTTRQTYNDGDSSGQDRVVGIPYVTESLLTINAVDGAVIDRELGY